jgi:hypothetical protein
MSAKGFCLGGLVLTLLGLGAVHGEGPGDSADSKGTPASAALSAPVTTPGPAAATWPGAADGPDGHAGPPAPPPAFTPLDGREGEPPPVGHATLSRSLIYPHTAGCCGPLGDGPVGYEFYLRGGVTFPVGGGIFGDVLDTGWDIQGGGRLLWFNPQVDAAWTLDVSLSNAHYHAGSRSAGRPFTLFNLPAQAAPFTAPGQAAGTTTQTSQSITVDSVTATVEEYNQTFFNAALGREWYLWGTADCAGGKTNWRVGFDAGGGWGSAKADLNYSNPDLTSANQALAQQGQTLDPSTVAIRHRTDVVGQVFFALHSDLEVPCGCCIFQAGVRAEYGYIWTDILQSQNRSDLQNVNLLITAGTRY